jgi:hypothetical protein
MSMGAGMTQAQLAHLAECQPFLCEVIVSRKHVDLASGICYASAFNMEPANELGRSLGWFYGADEYRIVSKPLGRSAMFNPEKK